MRLRRGIVEVLRSVLCGGPRPAEPVPSAAPPAAAEKPLDVDEGRHAAPAMRRPAAPKHIGAAVAVYFVALLGGMCGFAGKWHRTGPDAFQLLDREAAKPVRCKEYSHDKAPCYRLLHVERHFTWFFVDVLPFMPLLVSTLVHIWEERPEWKQVLSDARRRGFCYVAWLAAFYVVMVLHRATQALMFPFDASDHVAIALVGLTVAFRESAWVGERQIANGGRARLDPVLGVAGLVLLMQAYLGYYTSLYFHTPMECLVGFAVGGGLGAVCCRLLWWEGERGSREDGSEPLLDGARAG